MALCSVYISEIWLQIWNGVDTNAFIRHDLNAEYLAQIFYKEIEVLTRILVIHAENRGDWETGLPVGDIFWQKMRQVHRKYC